MPISTDEAANALRRACCSAGAGTCGGSFRKIRQWWEVEIEPEDLDRVRVFPRAQWRKVANGSFLIKDIAKRIKHQRFYGKTRDFVTRVQALSYKLRSPTTIAPYC